jgi:hypothetical protein
MCRRRSWPAPLHQQATSRVQYAAASTVHLGETRTTWGRSRTLLPPHLDVGRRLRLPTVTSAEQVAFSAWTLDFGSCWSSSSDLPTSSVLVEQLRSTQATWNGPPFSPASRRPKQVDWMLLWKIAMVPHQLTRWRQFACDDHWLEPTDSRTFPPLMRPDTTSRGVER